MFVPSYRRRVGMIEARNSAGLTQRQLADRLGRARIYVTHIEMGYRNPSFGVALEWAEALGVPLDLWKATATARAD